MSKRQQELLKLLLTHKEGLSADELAGSLAITRPAVRQHLSGLEVDGYVRRGDERKTAGRPGQTYVLSAAGANLFPKQYSWFSGLLLDAIKQERGSEGLSRWLEDIAGAIAASLAPRVAGKDDAERLDEVVAIMDELSFEARLVATADGPAIEASNCVYHDLARQHPEVCRFDVALLSKLSGKPLEQHECMVRGGHVCRFKATGTP
jgi:predicted ArsR family transcriptional regulator